MKVPCFSNWQVFWNGTELRTPFRKQVFLQTLCKNMHFLIENFFIRQLINSLQSDSVKDIHSDLITFCALVESFSFYAKVPTAFVQKHVPAFLVDSLHSVLKLQTK